MNKLRRLHSRIRILLLTLALGITGVSFRNAVYEKWTEIPVDLPKVESDSTLFIKPIESSQYEWAGRMTMRQGREISIDELIGNRDLSIYESGGEFSNCSVPLSEYKRCKQNAIKARDFILNHWKAKKRAYIAYSWGRIDSFSDSFVFIEPNENDRWHIVIRSTGDYRYATEVIEKEASSVKYKKSRTEDEYPFEIGSYYLVLTDEKGEIIEGF